MKKKFTIGTDPEFFIRSVGLHKPLKSSQFTKGTKDIPEDLGSNYSVHADNVMLELNIPAATDKKSFIKNILTGKSKLEKLVGNRALILAVPSLSFPYSTLTDKQDWEVGCDPDLSAYTENYNETVKFENSKDKGLRYAGGHVHVGIEEGEEDSELILNIIKAMDYLFLDMVMTEDLDQKRKEVYGNPGRFRFKEYGFEYRSLSNFWLRSEKTMSRVYDIVEEAVNNYQKYLGEKYEKQVLNYFQTTSNISAKKSENIVTIY